MNINCYDLYYAVSKSRDGKEIVIDKYKNNEKVYKIFDDFITPNHCIGRKSKNETLK